MRRLAFIAVVLIAAPAAALDMQAVNEAEWNPRISASRAVDPAVIKAQVLLDRAHFSPGEIDGKFGDNLQKAVAAFAAARGLPPADRLGEELWRNLTADAAAPVLTTYTVTEDDTQGPFARKIPAKMEAMQTLPALAYRSPREKLAEKFHMSEALLSALNPGQKFARSGDVIVVANVAADPLPAKAARIEVDKSAQTLTVFDRDRKLLAVYPATVGSDEKPAPSGTLKITEISRNPTYRYNPAYAFKGVRARKPFTIKPGPNNPVGLVWIGLSAEGYGIHGTPEPAQVSKTESHGCVRLTNWDALQLAAAVTKGVRVDFVDGAREARDEAKAEKR